MSSHLSDGQLIGYIHQTLTDAEREGMDRHLATCAQCRARLAKREATQRKIQYGLAGELRRVYPSSGISFVALAPRLRKRRRQAKAWMITRELSVIAALLVLALAISLRFPGPETAEQPVASPVASEPTLVPAPTPAPGAMFRGNPQRTGFYDVETVPLTGELAWSFETGGPIGTSPVIADGVVYFGSSDGYLYGLDLQTGAEVFKVETSSAAAASSSPAVVDGVVYVVVEDTVHAYDARTGEQTWKTALLGEQELASWQEATPTAKELKSWMTCQSYPSSPAVVDGTVYVGSTGHLLYALEAETGAVQWVEESGGTIFSSPAISGGMVYFGSGDGTLYAIDRQTGQVEWKFETGECIIATPAVADGIVYVSGLNNFLHAIDAQTGEGLWKAKATGMVIWSSPAVVGGTVYFGAEDWLLHAVDGQTGEPVWRFRTGRPVVSSPAVAGGAVYFGSHDHYFYAVDARTGEELWKYRTGGGIVSSPALAGGMVCFGGKDGVFYALR